ncbi:MAG: hypothetical protein M1834_003489 [Cirrosporium novae-zelandiae]|nr:MAG: hypothetical protein M1834_003489 [Cirrosporium novae-zelandiae]
MLTSWPSALQKLSASRMPSLTKRTATIRRLKTLPAFSLEGKTCVVTGAGRGLGKEFLTAFALSGAKGACVDRDIASAEGSIKHITAHVAEQWKETYPNDSLPLLRPYGCDVAVEADVKETWKRIVQDFGKIDCLVTAAGIVDNVAAEEYDYNRWRKMFDINLHGSWLFAQEAGKHMLQQDQGRIKGTITFISSMSGTICVRPQKQAAYNASKAAVTQMMRSLATEWGPQGVRVNSLSPGYMLTDLIKELLQKEGPEKIEQWKRDIPLGNLAHPSELQGAIVWMASDAASYLNGSDVVVDGGYTCW